MSWQLITISLQDDDHDCDDDVDNIILCLDTEKNIIYSWYQHSYHGLYPESPSICFKPVHKVTSISYWQDPCKGEDGALSSIALILCYENMGLFFGKISLRYDDALRVTSLSIERPKPLLSNVDFTCANALMPESPFISQDFGGTRRFSCIMGLPSNPRPSNSFSLGLDPGEIVYKVITVNHKSDVSARICLLTSKYLRLLNRGYGKELTLIGHRKYQFSGYDFRSERHFFVGTDHIFLLNKTKGDVYSFNSGIGSKLAPYKLYDEQNRPLKIQSMAVYEKDAFFVANGTLYMRYNKSNRLLKALDDPISCIWATDYSIYIIKENKDILGIDLCPCDNGNDYSENDEKTSKDYLAKRFKIFNLKFPKYNKPLAKGFSLKNKDFRYEWQ